MFRVTVLPENRVLEAAENENLLKLLSREGFVVDTPCGGEGKCGKCHVTVDGSKVLACHTAVCRDMTVILPPKTENAVLTSGVLPSGEGIYRNHKSLAFDMGTTTVAGYLLEESTGVVLTTASAPNPQRAYGADVVSRIRCACSGEMENLTRMIRQTLAKLSVDMCSRAHTCPEEIGTVAVVGNPAMQ